MPHDSKGRVIQAGDELILRCKAREVFPQEDACYVTIEGIHPEGCPASEMPPVATCNTRFFEKVEPTLSLDQDVRIIATGRQGKIVGIWEGKEGKKGSSRQYSVRFFDSTDRPCDFWFYPEEIEAWD